MPERIALLMLTLQGWTGWSREQPAPESIVVKARRGQVMGLADFGVTGAELESFNRIFGCQIRLMTLLEDRAVFEYQRLVIKNPSGSINLSAPSTGNFQLSAGQHIALATPTMDGGLSLKVRLDQIEDATGAVPAS